MHEFETYQSINAIINGKKYKLWVANDKEKIRKGLSNIDAIPNLTGMIFIYNKPVKNNFTMKETRIPLDIIFLDKKLKVVDFHSCKPFQIDPVKPKRHYSFVIEIKSG